MIWVKGALIVVAALLVVGLLIVRYGALRWESGTRALIARLEAVRVRPGTTRFDAARELDGLPAPVQRYFRAALTDGQSIISAVTLEHHGLFNLGERADRWKPFTSRQRVITHRPGFVWDGKVALLPGLDVRVHDAYVAGEGILHPAIIGLFTIVDLPRTEALARDELMRYFAEAAWYPTALLPSQGVRWEAVDEASARATLTDGPLGVSLLFHFGQDGMIDAVRADARGRMLAGVMVETPWEGRWWNYQMRNGMRVPLSGEVAWLAEAGRKNYWQGAISASQYEFVQP
jgi:hypothetical protein